MHLKGRTVLKIEASKLASLLVLILSPACSEEMPRYRYKMTVQISTPYGIREGSSVLEKRAQRRASFPGPEHGGVFGYVVGEAVRIDLGGGRAAYALLAEGDSNGGNDIVQNAIIRQKTLGNIKYNKIDYPTISSKISSTNYKISLEEEFYPLTIIFLDEKNPYTMENLKNNTHGYKVTNVIIESTKEKITHKIENNIPWINHPEKFRKDKNNPFTSTLPRELSFLRSSRSAEE